jgi:6-pyruvoyltetrahydropterin/6-carboxytetrahydropterin synthase
MFNYKYTSTKNYNQIGPVAYRQHRADSHCRFIHGYAMSFRFFFSTNDLDARNWAFDYGGLKPLKHKLEDWFDHTLLVAEDDPMKNELLRLGELKLAKITLVEKTGCEGLGQFLYDYVNEIFLPECGTSEAERLWCTKVEVRETDNNMAYVSGDRPRKVTPLGSMDQIDRSLPSGTIFYS